MLLHSYKITRVKRSYCNPEWIAVTAELSDDISEVFPYLNAVLKNAVYTPEVRNLNFKMEPEFIILMPREMSVGQVLYEEDAIKVLDYLKELINDTWERRENITPLYQRKGEIKAEDIVNFLPKTNCRDCGLPTCFAFAVAMMRGQKRLKDCSALSKAEFTEDKEALVRLLQTVGWGGCSKVKTRFPLASKRAHREYYFRGVHTVTMNKVIKILCLLILTCLALSLMAGCTTSSTAPPVANGGEPGYQEDASSNSSSSPIDKVEVVYFHRTQRCYSCKYVEAGTRSTVETYFKDELASGRVTFQVINVQDKENADIVKKYGAFTSSLFINTIKDGTDHIEEAMDIYLLIGDDEAFVEVVKGKIEKSLKGEA